MLSGAAAYGSGVNVGLGAERLELAARAAALAVGLIDDRRMPRLLVVQHTPSPALQAMFEAVVGDADTDQIEDVEVLVRPALTAARQTCSQADGYLLGTPANIGYMSGALKHFFDGIYYPCLEATQRRPYGLYVHGDMDTGGALRAVESITGGLRWRPIRPPVSSSARRPRPISRPAGSWARCWQPRSPGEDQAGRAKASTARDLGM